MTSPTIETLSGASPALSGRAATLLPAGVSRRRDEIRIADVIVRDRQRPLIDEHVDKIQASMEDLGIQLVAIAVSERPGGQLVLIDGNHRLEARRRQGDLTIIADVYTGLTPDHESLLELETNRLHAAMSPAEIHNAWVKWGLPLFQARAKDRQVEAGRSFGRGDQGKLPIDDGKLSGPPVSVHQAAVEMTGMSPQTLDMITQIETLVENQQAPLVVREAAEVAMEKLRRPGQPVRPVFKSLMKLSERTRTPAADPTAAEDRALEKMLDGLQADASFLTGKLTPAGVASKLHRAAQVSSTGSLALRSIRIELAKALAVVVVAECLGHPDARAEVALELYGRETMELISKECVARIEDSTGTESSDE